MDQYGNNDNQNKNHDDQNKNHDGHNGDYGNPYGYPPSSQPPFTSPPPPSQPPFTSQPMSSQPPFTSQPPFMSPPPSQPPFTPPPAQQYQYMPPGFIPPGEGSYKPVGYNDMSVKDWVVTLLICCIPCVGMIMSIVWAASNDNLTRRNFFRAYWIIAGILFAIGIIFNFLFYSSIYDAFRYNSWY